MKTLTLSLVLSAFTLLASGLLFSNSAVGAHHASVGTKSHQANVLETDSLGAVGDEVVGGCGTSKNVCEQAWRSLKGVEGQIQE